MISYLLRATITSSMTGYFIGVLYLFCIQFNKTKLTVFLMSVLCCIVLYTPVNKSSTALLSNTQSVHQKKIKLSRFGYSSSKMLRVQVTVYIYHYKIL